MTPPRQSERYLRGPSDLNDIASVLLGLREVGEARRVHLAHQVVCRMLALEGELLHIARVTPAPARSRKSIIRYLDKPMGWWR